MLLADYSVIPPKEYEHDPTLLYYTFGRNGRVIRNGTVAMLLA